MITAEILDDETTTLIQHHRRITLHDGPIIGAKKSRQKVAFQVTHLALKWFEGQEPGPVVAHGVYYHPKHGAVHVERSYDLDGHKCPGWIKRAVRGSDGAATTGE